MTLFEQFLSSSSKNIPRPAISYLGKEISYNDLRTSIARLSYLYQNELGTGARVALIARNSPAFIKTFFALTNIRAVVVPLSPDAAPEEWAEAFKQAHPTHVAITSDLLPKVREFLSHERLVLPIVEIERKQGGEYDTSFTAPSDQKPLETDVVFLLRTRGRNSKPKFVQFNHKHLQAACTSLRGCYKVLPTDRILTTLSWSHPFALIHGMLFPLMAGMTVVIDTGLQALEFLDFLTAAHVTRMVDTPPFYLKLLMTCRNEKRPLVGIKSATVGLGQLSLELRKVFQIMKIATPHVYGMTENVWTIGMESIEDTSLEPGAHGKCLPGLKYKVLDENGDTIEGADRRVGHLAVSGPTVMQGYLGKELEAETKNSLRGTWLYTGDYAELEGENDELKMNFLGRKEDVFKDGGEIIALDSVDLILRKLPGVQDAAAFISKNSKNQLVPVYVVVKTGAPLQESQILEYCAQKIEENLRPKAILFTDFIPRDLGGNVNHSKLRAQFSGAAG